MDETRRPTKEIKVEGPHNIFESVEPGFFTKTSFIQIGYGFLASQSNYAVGLSVGFTAVMIPQLKESHADLTIFEEAMITSVLYVTTPFVCIMSGYLVDKYGRQSMLCAGFLPMILGWVCTGLAKDVKMIVLGRVITGIGNGMSVTASRVYITEITLPKLRGVVLAFPNVAVALGISTQAIMGAYINWDVISFVCACHSLVFCVVISFVPETPYYMLKVGTRHLAKNCLQKIRSKDYDINEELNLLMEFKLNNDIRRLKYREKIALLGSSPTCVPLTILCGYMLFSQFAGVSIITFSTVDILKGLHSSMDEYLGTFLLGLTRVIGSIILAIAIFKPPRKVLALISAGGVCLVCFTLGFYMLWFENSQHKKKKTIVPQILLTIYTLFASLGYLALPLIIAFEMYPLQVRGLLGGVTVAFYDLNIFLSTLIYPYIRQGIGLPNVFLMFGGFSFTCFFYLLLFLPETNGISLIDIEEQLKTHVRLMRRQVSIRDDLTSVIEFDITPDDHTDGVSKDNLPDTRKSDTNISKTKMADTQKEDT